MRKIESQEEIEKRRKRNIMIISLMMLGLLVTSTLGFAFLSNPYVNTRIEDTNEIIPQQNNRISFQYEGTSVTLISSYSDIENVTVDIDAYPKDYLGKKLYIAADNQGILTELASGLGRFSSNIQEACYGRCEKNLPERNCTSDNLIVWKESEENKVYQEDNCIFIEGDIKTVDAFIYKLFSK